MILNVQKRHKPRVYYRKQKKREEMKEIAANRVWDNIEENHLQPTLDINDNIDTTKFMPQEYIHQNNLRAAYRDIYKDMNNFDTSDPQYLYDDVKLILIHISFIIYVIQQLGEEWYNKKMGVYEECKMRRAQWRSFLLSTSISKRVTGHILNKIPNNQAPFTIFNVKNTIHWLSDNREYLHKHGMPRKHIDRYFRRFDHNYMFREWPAHSELKQYIHNKPKKQRIKKIFPSISRTKNISKSKDKLYNMDQE